MKVSLYIRQRGTREFQKHNPKKSYPQNGSVIWFLRYGSTWETLDVKTLSEATSLRLRRQIDARSEAAASRSRPVGLGSAIFDGIVGKARLDPID